MNKIDLQKIKDSLVETEFPQYVILEPTNYCNLKCIMCPHDVMPRAKGFMDFELFKRIVDEIVLKSPKSKLWPAVLGESLIGGDRFKRMVDYAVSRQVDIVLNTNGTLLNDDWVSYFSTCGIKEIILGVDGFSKETYEKIRVKGSYENLHAKILKLVKACQDTAGAPNVILQIIAMEENRHEIEDYKNYWTSQGAIVKIRSKLGWGNHISTDLPFGEKDRVFPCPWIIRTILILWDGTVCQCNADVTEASFPVGDVNKQSIEEIWMGELKKHRDRHWKGDFAYAPCQKCDDWKIGLSEFHYPKGYKKETTPVRDKANEQFKEQKVEVEHSIV